MKELLQKVEIVQKVEVEVEKVRSRSRKSRNCSKSRIWIDNVELLQKVDFQFGREREEKC